MNATQVPYATKAVSTTTVTPGTNHHASVRSVRGFRVGRAAPGGAGADRPVSTLRLTRRESSVRGCFGGGCARSRGTLEVVRHVLGEVRMGDETASADRILVSSHPCPNCAAPVTARWA